MPIASPLLTGNPNDITVFDVVQKAVACLGDDQQEITQTILDDFGTSYTDLLNVINKVEAPTIIRSVTTVLQPNTNIIMPMSLNTPDFGEPRQLWERGNVAYAPLDPVTSIIDGTPLTIQFQTNFSGGGLISLIGIQNAPPWVNRDWYVTPVLGQPTQVTLNGSVGITGTPGTVIAGSTGYASWSTDSWTPMIPQDYAPASTPPPPTAALGVWRWKNGQIEVPAPQQAVQVWIQYTASTIPPATGFLSLAFGRELYFLAYATAARFAPKRQLTMGPQLFQIAYGPTGEPDGSGGMLRELIVPMMQQQQGIRYRSGLFRRRRGVALFS
jgi:hypothetical protein